jgi:small subunit ribosomal protein S12
MEKRPQIKGIIIKAYTKAPKKPNSAARKVARVRIREGERMKEVEAFITGKKAKELGFLSQNIGEQVVLLIPKRKKDLPGVKYRLV